MSDNAWDEEKASRLQVQAFSFSYFQHAFVEDNQKQQTCYYLSVPRSSGKGPTEKKKKTALLNATERPHGPITSSVSTGRGFA